MQHKLKDQHCGCQQPTVLNSPCVYHEGHHSKSKCQHPFGDPFSTNHAKETLCSSARERLQPSRATVPRTTPQSESLSFLGISGQLHRLQSTLKDINKVQGPMSTCLTLKYLMHVLFPPSQSQGFQEGDSENFKEIAVSIVGFMKPKLRSGLKPDQVLGWYQREASASS